MLTKSEKCGALLIGKFTGKGEGGGGGNLLTNLLILRGQGKTNSVSIDSYKLTEAPEWKASVTAVFVFESVSIEIFLNIFDPLADGIKLMVISIHG